MKASIKFFIILVLLSIRVSAIDIAKEILSSKNSTDLIIFSYDRPLQLYALLESIEMYMTGLSTIKIIYRTSNDQFKCAYDEIKNRFSYVTFIKQGPNPKNDFKSLTIDATFKALGKYVLFAVDDNIIKDYVNVNECIQLMEKYSAYAFFLRLGVHLTYCYSANQPQATPPYVQLEPGVISWYFSQGEYDWNYPHNVDLTLYRKKDIEATIKSFNFVSPNSFEGAWATRHYKTGLCYEYTKIVNLPLNRVQNDNTNRSMEFMTPTEMLAIFHKSMKIDIMPLYKIINESAHMVYKPVFIPR